METKKGMQLTAYREWTAEVRGFVWYNEEDCAVYVINSPRSSKTIDPQIAHNLLADEAELVAAYQTNARKATTKGGAVTPVADQLLALAVYEILCPEVRKMGHISARLEQYFNRVKQSYEAKIEYIKSQSRLCKIYQPEAEESLLYTILSHKDGATLTTEEVKSALRLWEEDMARDMVRIARNFAQNEVERSPEIATQIYFVVGKYFCTHYNKTALMKKDNPHNRYVYWGIICGRDYTEEPPFLLYYQHSTFVYMLVGAAYWNAFVGGAEMLEDLHEKAHQYLHKLSEQDMKDMYIQYVLIKRPVCQHRLFNQARLGRIISFETVLDTLIQENGEHIAQLYPRPKIAAIRLPESMEADRELISDLCKNLQQYMQTERDTIPHLIHLRMRSIYSALVKNDKPTRHELEQEEVLESRYKTKHLNLPTTVWDELGEMARDKSRGSTQRFARRLWEIAKENKDLGLQDCCMTFLYEELKAQLKFDYTDSNFYKALRACKIA